MSKKKRNKPWILVVDIETAPVLAYVWALFDQNIGLNQIQQDWFVLSWSAKWLESEDGKIVYGPHRKMMYKDNRNSRNIENDKTLLKPLHKLMSKASIVLGQNSKRFDTKKLNARFIINGMSPPPPYRHLDTLVIAKKHFAFTSNKLEYMSNTLTPNTKKSSHKKFPGFELWRECLAGNMEAWNEMAKYNPQDVLSTEAIFHKLTPWDNSIDFNVYKDENDPVTCNCGSDKLQRRGYSYTNTSKYQRYQCQNCGSWSRGKQNMITKDKRDLFKGKA